MREAWAVFRLHPPSSILPHHLPFHVDYRDRAGIRRFFDFVKEVCRRLTLPRVAAGPVFLDDLAERVARILFKEFGAGDPAGFTARTFRAINSYFMLVGHDDLPF